MAIKTGIFAERDLTDQGGLQTASLLLHICFHQVISASDCVEWFGLCWGYAVAMSCQLSTPAISSPGFPCSWDSISKNPLPHAGVRTWEEHYVESARWKRSHLSLEAVCSQEPKMMWGLQQFSRELQEWLTLGLQPEGVRRSFLDFLKNCRTFPANSSIITHVRAKMTL